MESYGIHTMTHATPDEGARATLRVVYSLLSIWFLAAFIGGIMGIFGNPGAPPTGVGSFLVVPIGGFIIAYASSTRLRQALGSIPLWVLTVAQVWRFVGLFFVFNAIIKVLPWQFGYPEGFGDVLAGTLSIPLTVALRKPERSPRLRGWFIAWNIYGLTDLVSAITMGILYSPGPFGILRTDISTALMTRFPVNLIPTFFVPLCMLIHILSLARNSELAKTRSEVADERVLSSNLTR